MVAATSTTAVPTVPILSGGQWIELDTGSEGDVYNPSTGRVIARVPLASGEETAQVVAAALPDARVAILPAHRKPLPGA